ncbi:MAG: RIP metalloprotease RseP [Dysgonamonadaceae bacterium]|jgi:regulator of sigma E protease|nr:RIP metalloprotease RseP [Dysgonamonadaceae bacterium]
METVIIKAIQFILSLSILVIVHECGHFLFARLFKVRVEKFYLFFNPWFSLFKFKPKNSETEYGIGWLPLGGYVKIAGMLDESMDKEALKQPPQPWEFRTHPAWQRLFIMVGGVLMNFILAFFIYSMVILAWGDNYIPMNKAALYFSETAHQAGFQDGDILLSADGKTLSRYDDLDLFRVIDAKNIIVLRGGSEVSLNLPEDFKRQFLISKTPFADIASARADNIVPGSNAEKAGLQAGDKLISINGKATNSEALAVFSSRLSKYKKSDVELGIVRGQDTLRLSAHVDKEGKLGFSSATPKIGMSDQYGFFRAFPAGIGLGVRKMAFYVLQLKLVFSKAGISSIGGFGAIGNLFPAAWDWFAFWMLTALLSIMLGVMNLLPVPALDGGHVLFLLYEVITRRQPSEKFLEYAQMAGMAFLIGLLLYANGMDVVRAFFK